MATVAALRWRDRTNDRKAMWEIAVCVAAVLGWYGLWARARARRGPDGRVWLRVGHKGRTFACDFAMATRWRHTPHGHATGAKKPAILVVLGSGGHTTEMFYSIKGIGAQLAASLTCGSWLPFFWQITRWSQRSKRWIHDTSLLIQIAAARPRCPSAIPSAPRGGITNAVGRCALLPSHGVPCLSWWSPSTPGIHTRPTCLGPRVRGGPQGG